MMVRDLLARIAPDTQGVVQQACDMVNQGIRSRLNNDLLRFKLVEGGTRTTISISVDEIGFPTSVSERHIPKGAERAALLALYQPASQSLVDAARMLGPLFGPDSEETWKETELIPAVSRTTLTSAERLGLRLQALLRPTGGNAPFDLVRFILEVNEDVLGIYWPGPGGEIRIYWGVIGLIARSLGIDTRALSVVVLAHELAHGYTHLGADRDGIRWDIDAFLRSDRRVTEGIAQYYTHLVCERMDRGVPGLLVAYRRLLEKQPEAYQTHLAWLEHSTPERVASELARLRRGKSVSLDEMDGALGIKMREWLTVTEHLGRLDARVSGLQRSLGEE